MVGPWRKLDGNQPVFSGQVLVERNGCSREELRSQAAYSRALRDFDFQQQRAPGKKKPGGLGE